MPSRDPAKPTAYAWYVLAVVVLVQALCILDRTLINVLFEDIRHGIPMSDTQIGLLGGLLFTGVYCASTLVVARLADTAPRRVVVSLAIAAWSLCTAAGGLARSFPQLAFSRVGLAMGESGGAAPTHSLISDYFPIERRAFALSIVASGSSLGTLSIAPMAALAQAAGWRVALATTGLAGLALSALMYLTVREPRRGAMETVAPVLDRPTTVQALCLLWNRKSFRWVTAGVACYVAAQVSMMTFVSPYLIRALHFTTGQAGLLMGLGLGLAGLSGALISGVVAGRLGRIDGRWIAGVPTVGLIAAAGLSFAALASGPTVMFPVLVIPAYFMSWMTLGPSYAIVQSVVPPQVRAFAAAVLLLIGNGLGSSVGPLTVGMVSDALKPIYGANTLGLALMVSPVGYLLGALCFWGATRSVVQDMASGAESR